MFTSNNCPFGRKLSAFIYHPTSLFASHFFRSIGVPCCLYIHDRNNGQLLLRNSSILPEPYSPLPSQRDVNFALASFAIFLVCYYLTKPRYCIGLSKSSLIPSTQVPYLGFNCDSHGQAFCLLPEKKRKFITLLNDILAKDLVCSIFTKTCW